MDGARAFDDAALEAVETRPVEEIHVLAVVGEGGGEAADLLDAFAPEHPVGRHEEMGVVAGELVVQAREVRLHLHRADQPVFRVLVQEGGEAAEGVRQQPGVLVQQVDIAVATLQRPAQADVVGGAEAVVGHHPVRLDALLLQPVRRPVRGRVVDDEEVGVPLRGADGRNGLLDPAAAVVRDDYDQGVCHLSQN